MFSLEIIHHLKRVYARRYDRIAQRLSKKYNIGKDEAVKAMNLETDLHASRFRSGVTADRIAVPDLRLPIRFTRFANGEVKAEIRSSIRGMDIFIVQDVENHYPLKFYNSDELHTLSVNDHVMTLLITIDTVLQAGAGSVTLVLPTYPFSRQHRKKSREALTASMFGRIVEDQGVKRIITLDIHSKEIENTFRNVRLENLHASYQTTKRLREIVDINAADMVVVSPDTGAVDQNKYYAGNFKKPLALLYKERDYSKVTHSAKDNNITNVRLLGSVKDKTVFMADDLLGTGGTLIQAMRFLKGEGAKDIICAASLPLFTGNAITCFDEAYQEGLFHRIIGTNAVYHDQTLLDCEWYVQAPIADLFAQIIFRLHHNRSLSALLDNSNIIQRLLTQ